MKSWVSEDFVKERTMEGTRRREIKSQKKSRDRERYKKEGESWVVEVNTTFDKTLTQRKWSSKSRVGEEAIV